MDEFIKNNACIVMLQMASQCLLAGSRMFAQDDVVFLILPSGALSLHASNVNKHYVIHNKNKKHLFVI